MASQQGWNQQTPAIQTLLRTAVGSAPRKARTKARSIGAKVKRAASKVRRVASKVKKTKARLVKGSAAAKRYMAKIRKLRK